MASALELKVILFTKTGMKEGERETTTEKYKLK